jgi:pimeloyl-ACP methyl ester carboxylesterase
MRLRSLILLVTLATATVTLTGCSHLRGDGPLQLLSYPAAATAAQKPGLIVFLRGMGGSHRSFDRAGWVEAVRSRDLAYAMAAPNAHFGYYRERSLVHRLHDEVVGPALAAGSEPVWLVGVSMGGLGSLLYLRERPEDLDGVVLVAPFLGDQELIEEIAAAGGVEAWDPGTVADDDWQRQLWLWLKQLTASDRGPTVVLAFGRDDRYAAAHRLLAEALPADQVISGDGGHRVRVFTTLWNEVLERGLIE